MKYIFPFAQVNKDSRIVLYGASDIGYDYYRQVMSTGYANVIAWLDSNYEMYRLLGLSVDPPERITELEFDAVVVAIQSENTFVAVKRFLTESGVNADIIIWARDPVAGYDIAKNHEDIDPSEEAENAVKISPVELIDEDRLDVVVRCIYAKEILNGEIDGTGKRLYEKMFMTLNRAIEPTDHFLFRYFSDYSTKSGLEAFEDSFRKLIMSIKSGGFRRECFIPLDRNGRMMNGSHRCAAALALGVDVWARKYPVTGVKILDHHFGRQWFEASGFAKEDIELITGTLTKISCNN